MSDHREAHIASAPPIPTRICIHCEKEKPETAFHRRRKGRMRICGECRRVTRPKWNETSAERFDRKLRYEYQLTREQYEALVLSQNGLCAICGRAPEPGKRLVIDHCHSTGQVRALLCIYCNTVVGAYENHRTEVVAYLVTYGNGNPLLKQETAR